MKKMILVLLICFISISLFSGCMETTSDNTNVDSGTVVTQPDNTNNSTDGAETGDEILMPPAMPE